MFVRLLIAFAGACAITIGLLLGMHRVAEELRVRDPTKFFRITDVIVLPGSRKPERPPAPELPPDRVAPELPRPEGLRFGFEGPARPVTEPVPSADIPAIVVPDEPVE